MTEHDQHDHAHDDEDELDYDAGDFWVHIASSTIPELATEESGTIWDRNLQLSTSGNVANGTILTSLLFAYIGFHDRLLEHHQCSDADCRLVGLHRQVRDMLETVLDQTAHLLERCDEAPETGEDVEGAEEHPA